MFDIRKLGLGGPKPGQTGKGKKKKAAKNSSEMRIHAAEEKTFSDILEASAEPEGREAVAAILEDLEAQGELLKENPNRQEFLKYRKLIRKFFKLVVKEAFSITKQKVYKKEREYISLKIIDERLYELGKYILLEEAETIEIASRIDEIKGLIYDSARDASDTAL